MKSVAAVLFLSVQLAGSSFAAHLSGRAENENVMQERQRDLQKQTPLNAEEKILLTRLLSEKTLRYANEVSDDQSEHRNLAGSDALSIAMRESAHAKIADLRGAESKKMEEDSKVARRAQNNYNSYYGYGYGNNAVPVEQVQTNVYAARVPIAAIPEKVSMVLEAFQDSRRLSEPIKLTPDTSYLTAGTEYLFSSEPLFNTVFDVPPGGNRAAYLVNENNRIAVVSGTCTRNDPKTNYVGRSYCQLEYRFLDGQGEVEASILAEGPITMGDINTLSITGGSGIFRRIVGTVVLEAGELRGGNPPIFIPNDSLDLPSSYMVKMFVFMDSVDLEQNS